MDAALRVSGAATLAAVALGGAIGATARYLCVGVAARLFGHGFPMGTLLVNVVGSAAMGLVAAALLERSAAGAGAALWPRVAPFAITGVLGGFTTFSAFSLDALYLIERERFGAAALYIGGSVALSIIGLWLGMSAARRGLL